MYCFPLQANAATKQFQAIPSLAFIWHLTICAISVIAERVNRHMCKRSPLSHASATLAANPYLG